MFKTCEEQKLYVLQFSWNQTFRFASKSIKNRRCLARRYDVYDGRTFTFNTSSERSHDFLSRQYIMSGCKILPSGRKTALKNHNFESKKCVTYDVIHDVNMTSEFFLHIVQQTAGNYLQNLGSSEVLALIVLS